MKVGARLITAIALAILSFLVIAVPKLLAENVPRPLADPDAMQTLFGRYDVDHESANSTLAADKAVDLKGSGFAAGDKLVVRPFWKSTYRQVGILKTVFLTYAVPFDPSWKPIGAGDSPFSCHACAPLIGIALFRWSGNRWTMETSREIVIRSGGWGLPPATVQLLRVGPHLTGVELTEVNEGGGTKTTSKVIIALAGSNISDALRIFVEEEDDGGCEPKRPSDEPACYHWKKTLSFQRGSNINYYDIRAVLRGNDFDRNNVGRVHDISGVEVFQFQFTDNRYQRAYRRGSVTSTEQVVGAN